MKIHSRETSNFPSPAELGDGEDCEQGEGDYFLRCFELGGEINLMADLGGGNSEAILKKGDAPTDAERRVGLFELPIPGEGSEHD